MPNREPAADRGLWTLSDPQLSNPAKMRKKYSWVNIAVCPRLQLISQTQPISTLSRIKCERYIFFIKKCVRSLIEVRHYCWLCFRLYLCYLYACGYITEDYQHHHLLKDCWAPNLFFTRESMYFYSIDCFSTRARYGKPMFSQFLNFFFYSNMLFHTH